MQIPFGYTRKDVLLIGLGITALGVGLKYGLEVPHFLFFSYNFLHINVQKRFLVLVCDVNTSVAQVLFLKKKKLIYHLGIYNEDFTFFDVHRLWVFDSIFVSDTIWVYKPSKNNHAQSKIALVSIWFRMVSTQIRTWVYKDSLTLRYPPNINI